MASTADSSKGRARSRMVTSSSNSGDVYSVSGFILIILTVASLFAGNVAINSANLYKSQIEEIIQNHDQLVTQKEGLERKLRVSSNDIRKINEENVFWKQSDTRLTKPWTASASAWLAAKLREQPTPLMDEGATLQPGGKDAHATIDMQVSGEFTSLLKWLMECESELSVVRVMKATWQPRVGNMLGLTLLLEVADE